jgi:hypothetical protein
VDKAGKLKYGKTFVRYETIEVLGKPGKVQVYFEDGSTDEGDVLISAEGSHSKVISLFLLSKVRIN